ncbi:MULTISPECIES: cytochrome P450 [Cyanophyceae]|uniref:cytochrome P450 n=1 Tax=Cyanophyceae TaxID=3028117 RepID=UPI00168A0826|nr:MULTISPECIES: cytochrome P450 [Cyanophyceae]MBD1919175.1 cytochrome P450 [Phormidium sp. FACHB-77]MBD2033180.1 cytochrome P450 [Phormidium sp. FACHB-322]MBD2054122.1 cytochrome P450 [Leptolyngbya sp. FACHB-60]
MTQLLGAPLLLLPLIGLGAIGLLGWQRWAKQQRFKSLRSQPSPPQHWLLGNIPQLLGAVKNRQLFQILFDWSKEFGPKYVYWVGYPVLVLSQPKLIDSTIVQGTRDGSLVRTGQSQRAWNDLMGPIMIGQDGPEWQWRRKAWNPEFSSSGVSHYFALVDQACHRTVTQLQATLPGEPVPMDPPFVELTMRVIAALVLGIPIDPSQPSPEGPPLEIEPTYDAMAVLTYRFLRMAVGEKAWRKYLPTQASKDYWAARHYLEDGLRSRLDLALQLRDGDPAALEKASPLFQQSMLVKIAAKEPRYTRATLLPEIVELLIGGTDTTAHTLSLAVGELALNPSVFQQAQATVDRVFDDQDAITLASLKQLSYLQGVVKETLRLYSVASGTTSLQATRDIVVDGVEVPAGARLFWSMLGAGRDPETYPQSEKFWPERWLTEDRQTPAPLMIDFGSGPHRCLGEHLAMLESTLMLAYLLRHFDWELVNGRSSVENLKQNLLIYPVDRMPVYLQCRSR